MFSRRTITRLAVGLFQIPVCTVLPRHVMSRGRPTFTETSRPANASSLHPNLANEPVRFRNYHNLFGPPEHNPESHGRSSPAIVAGPLRMSLASRKRPRALRPSLGCRERANWNAFSKITIVALANPDKNWLAVRAPHILRTGRRAK